MRGGGEGSFGGCSDNLGKNFRIPDLAAVGALSLRSSSSASEGIGDKDERDERSEESSSTAAMALKLGCCDASCCECEGGRWKKHVVCRERCGCTSYSSDRPRAAIKAVVTSHRTKQCNVNEEIGSRSEPNLSS